MNNSDSPLGFKYVATVVVAAALCIAAGYGAGTFLVNKTRLTKSNHDNGYAAGLDEGHARVRNDIDANFHEFLDRYPRTVLRASTLSPGVLQALGVVTAIDGKNITVYIAGNKDSRDPVSGLIGLGSNNHVVVSVDDQIIVTQRATDNVTDTSYQYANISALQKGQLVTLFWKADASKIVQFTNVMMWPKVYQDLSLFQ